MTTSTPPAWKWRDECAVPLATDPCPDCGGSHKPWVLCHECYVPEGMPFKLSIGPRKLPDSAGLRVQNDSNPDPTYQDCWPSERYPSDGPGTAPETTSPADSYVVEFCPECGTVFDIDYKCPDETLDTLDPILDQSADNDPHHIPFETQEFMFEELCEEKLAELPHLIFTHHDRIIEMARDRFRDGYKIHGSKMYSWTPERRLFETLCEVADATVYPTSGPIE